MIHNSRSRSPKNRRAVEHLSENTGFVFEEHSTRHSPSPKRSAADKWAALGDRRRSPATQAMPQTPSKSIKSPKQAQSLSTSARKRSKTGTWRRPAHWGPGQHENQVKTPTHAGWEQKVDNWYKSKDWRQHSSQVQANDDIGDLEWVF
jgi:hypothetical protein